MRVRLIILTAASLLTLGCANHATRAAGKRMIVLGVDGMDPAFVEAHFDALPNLHRLRQQGAFRRLATTIPPQSPVAWSSVITGMDPGGHGIFDLDFEVQDVTAERLGQAIGERGIAHGRRASIITVDPARNAASAAVNGKDASTSAK